MPDGVVGTIDNNPDYVLLKSKVQTLQAQLDRVMPTLADAIAQAPEASAGSTAYRTLAAQKTTAALVEAQLQLSTLEARLASSNSTQKLEYQLAQAYERTLSDQLAGLTWQRAAYLIPPPPGSQESGADRQAGIESNLRAIELTKAALFEATARVVSMAPDAVAYSNERNPEYVILQAKVQSLRDQLNALMAGIAANDALPFEASGNYTSSITITVQKTSAALAEAQKQLTTMETEFANSSSAKSLDYQMAGDYVKSLSDQLASLNQKKASLLSSTAAPAQTSNSLFAGSPSKPEQAIPLTLTASILVGALAGLIIAWIVLNFRWLFGGSPSASKEPDIA